MGKLKRLFWGMKFVMVIARGEPPNYYTTESFFNISTNYTGSRIWPLKNVKPAAAVAPKKANFFETLRQSPRAARCNVCIAAALGSSVFFYVIWGRSIIYAAVPQNCDTQKNTAGWDSKRLSMGLLITTALRAQELKTKEQKKATTTKIMGPNLIGFARD